MDQFQVVGYYDQTWIDTEHVKTMEACLIWASRNSGACNRFHIFETGTKTGYLVIPKRDYFDLTSRPISALV